MWYAPSYCSDVLSLQGMVIVIVLCIILLSYSWKKWDSQFITEWEEMIISLAIPIYKDEEQHLKLHFITN